MTSREEKTLFDSRNRAVFSCDPVPTPGTKEAALQNTISEKE